MKCKSAEALQQYCSVTTRQSCLAIIQYAPDACQGIVGRCKQDFDISAYQPAIYLYVPNITFHNFALQPITPIAAQE